MVRKPKLKSGAVRSEAISRVGQAALRARSFTSTKQRTDASADIVTGVLSHTSKANALADPFSASDYGGDNDFVPIEPEYPYNLLMRAARSNSALPQCVEAYVVNIERYGYQLEYTGKVGSEAKPAQQAQKNNAIMLLDYPTGDMSLKDIRELRRKDKEYLGSCYIEVGRDIADRIVSLDHLPAMTMRKTKKDKTKTTYEVPVRSPDGKIVMRQWSKNFRRYVQVGANGKKTYFKELGDPRTIDPKNGKVNEALAIEDAATEVYVEELSSPGLTYGCPRWIGALPDMLGLRESELVNLNFFRENAIPAMAILISGGALTEESYDKVVNIINSAKGKDAMNRVLILEAAADESMSSTEQVPPAPKIDMKPMQGERQQDATFQEYQKSGKRKIRSSMRLPALYTGDTEEYTKATAQSGIRVAEQQVFAPERASFDDFINTKVFPTLGITDWRFKTMGPTTYDPDTLSVLLDRLNRAGAMTPNVLVKIANQLLDVQIEAIPGDWGDVPFAYTLGMVGEGRFLTEYEKLFTEVQTATSAAGVSADNPGNDTGAANDNNAEAKIRAKVRSILKREIAKVTDEILEEVNERIALAA